MKKKEKFNRKEAIKTLLNKMDWEGGICGYIGYGPDWEIIEQIDFSFYRCMRELEACLIKCQHRIELLEKEVPDWNIEE